MRPELGVLALRVSLFSPLKLQTIDAQIFYSPVAGLMALSQ